MMTAPMNRLVPLNKRQFLQATLALGAAAASAAPAPAADASPPADGPAMEPAPDLLDPAFDSVDDRGFTSDAIHLGEAPGFSVTPIEQAKNVRGGYQRPGNNATLAAWETKIRSLEGAEAAASGPCGMSIITQTLLTFLSAGDRLIVHRCVYDNVMELLRKHLARLGIEVVFVDMADPANLAEALAAKKTAVVHFEPYVNPTCEVLDAPALIREAKAAGALCIVDNTWLSPYLFQPLRRGADLVIHSATKYLGGHGSAMGGVVCGSKAHVDRIRTTMNAMGGILRPFDAFLLTQGVKTLAMRMRQHTASGLEVARFLESHPKVARVRYGGLPSWKGQAVAAGYLRGCGGMLGVEWKDDATHAAFGGRLKLCKPWVSLGDVVTLVSKRNPEADRGIPERYTRISVGLEDTADIIADFEQALA